MYQLVTETANFIRHAIPTDDLIDVNAEPATSGTQPASKSPSLQKQTISVTGFGHLGDGNLHLNVLLKGRQRAADISETLQIKRQLNEFIYDKCIAMGGSISAEHGIGVEKMPYMTQMHKEATLSLMRGVKQLHDPDRKSTR